MSNIFGPINRTNASGKLGLSTGVGAIPAGASRYNHLWVGDFQDVYASIDQPITHHGAGLPFDADGRLVVTNAPVTYWDQGVPFAASGAVSISFAGRPDFYDQGVGYADSGSITQDL